MNSIGTTANVYLNAYLAPLAPWLTREDVTDVLINRPGEVWIETAGGGMKREAAPDLTEQSLQRLARQIAAASSQGVNREQPLLSATLPDGARVQIAAPPATRGPAQGNKAAISSATSPSMGKRPIRDLLNTRWPSTLTSKTPRSPLINAQLAASPKRFASSATRPVACGR